MDIAEESKLLGHEIVIEHGRFSVTIGGKTYSGPVDQYRRDKMLRRARIFLRKSLLLGDVAGDKDQPEDEGGENQQ